MSKTGQFVVKSYARLGLQSFIMVLAVLIGFIGILSNFLSGIPIIGKLFAVSSTLLWGIEIILVVILGVL